MCILIHANFFIVKCLKSKLSFLTNSFYHMMLDKVIMKVKKKKEKTIRFYFKILGEILI